VKRSAWGFPDEAEQPSLLNVIQGYLPFTEGPTASPGKPLGESQGV
jgi:hypothetical protein